MKKIEISQLKTKKFPKIFNIIFIVVGLCKSKLYILCNSIIRK